MSKVEGMRKNIQSVLLKYDVEKKISRYVSYLKKHPVFSAIVGIVTAFYAVPIAIYLAFSIAAFIITFIGFLVILGGILLVGFLVLSSVLATITVIVAFVSFISWIIYTIYDQLNHVTDVLTVYEETSRRNHQIKEEPLT